MDAELDVTELPAGLVLMGKYRVVETIGVGGMGVVVAAEHLSLGAKVAIKFMLPALVSNDAVVRRFLNEARAATRIHSEHVARVLDVGTMSGPGLPEEGIPYMVMEYLQGHDLSFYTRSGRRFSVAEAIDFVVQACEALAHAHKAGIIHRDIKPANLFLAQYEERQNVKVLDFGISKVLDDEPQEMSLTKTTTVLGSGLYMSPEQMRSAKNVDIRTDIYSLGICLFELLTGTQPFTADTFSELCVKVNIDPPTPLRTYRPDISDDLAAVIAKAYARSVDDRYQSVQQLVAALAPYAAPTSTGTIHHVQGITRAEGRQPSVPPPPLAAVAATVGTSPEIRPAPPHALAGTAGALTASREAAPKAKPIGILVSVAVAALVAAGVAGVMLMRGNDDKAVGSDSARAAPSSAQPTAERSAPPAASSTIVASAEPSASSASPSPSSSASTKAAGSSRPPPLPPPVRSQTASAAPPLPPPPVNLKCFKTNPVTGLKEPCL